MLGVVQKFVPSLGLNGSVYMVDTQHYVRTPYGNVKVDAQVGLAMMIHQNRVAALARAYNRTRLVIGLAFLLGAIGGALLR